MAQSELTASELGIYEQWMFVQYALSFFWVSGLVQGFLTHYHRVDPEKRASVAFSAYWTLWGAPGVLAALLLFFRNPLLTALTGHPENPRFSLFLVSLVCNFATFLDDQRQIRQARQDQIKAQADARMRLADNERLLGEDL